MEEVCNEPTVLWFLLCGNNHVFLHKHRRVTLVVITLTYTNVLNHNHDLPTQRHLPDGTGIKSHLYVNVSAVCAEEEGHHESCSSTE